MKKQQILSAFQSRPGERGQTLVLTLIAMVILVMAVFIIFDMQSVIRTKLKSQTALDAAALTGAEWQRHSLNLIGELNLVKACKALVDEVPHEAAPDAPDYVPEEYEENWQELWNFRDSINLLCEMQARVSFVGPLIGFGAAQQAAKNNGLNYNSDYGNNFYSIFYLRAANGYAEMEQYFPANTDSNHISGDYATNREGFLWCPAYTSMLATVMDKQYASSSPKGVAVGPNTRMYNMPRLSSDSSIFNNYLTSQSIYQAILGEDWCELRDLLRMDFGGDGSNWWGNIQIVYDNTRSPFGSEILPVNITFQEESSNNAFSAAEDNVSSLNSERSQSSLLTDEYDRQNPITILGTENDSDTDGHFDYLGYVKWAVYDTSGGTYSWSTDWDTSWNDWLETPVKGEYQYYGAFSRFRCKVPLTNLTGKWKSSTGSENDYIGENFEKTTSTKMKSYAQRMQSIESRFKNSTLPDIQTSSLAKPLGSLPASTAEPPNAIRMVLPVFDQVCLMPTTIEPTSEPDPFNPAWYYFYTELLPLLGQCDSLSELNDLLSDLSEVPSDPDDSYWSSDSDLITKYKEAHNISGDLSESQINSIINMKSHSSSYTSYYSALSKLNNAEWRAKGIAWLETPVTWHTEDVDGDGVIEDDEIIIDSTREDYCDTWYSSGGGGGGRYGPSRLR